MYDAMKAAGVTVDFQAGVPWDPAQIIVDAYRKLGTAATYEQIRQYILGLKDYAGISGVYDFSDRGAGVQRGLTSKDVLVMRWDEGEDRLHRSEQNGRRSTLMITPEENERLTRVGPGTPMGESAAPLLVSDRRDRRIARRGDQARAFAGRRSGALSRDRGG